MKQIKKIFSKAIGDRNASEIQMVEQSLNTKVQYFKELLERPENSFTEKEMRQLYKQLNIRHYNARDTVFNYDESGKEFFIILDGSVLVLLPKKGLISDSEEESLSELPPNSQHQKLSKSTSKRKLK